MTNLIKNYGKNQIKRRLASRKGCLNDLQDELPVFFEAYSAACANYNKEVTQTPPESRCRGFEASLLNSKLIQAFQSYFPTDWKYGKYRRFILNKKGYLVLLKKLDSKGMPMNIRTKIIESIKLQEMGSLFEDNGGVEEPILYFGYKRDKFGNICQPQVVYIDENKIRWTIPESDVAGTKVILGIEKPSEPVAPILRSANRKAINE